VQAPIGHDGAVLTDDQATKLRELGPADRQSGRGPRPDENPEHHPDREACEHAKEARSSLRKSIEELIPPGFIEHRRAARREMLLALRSLLDAAIERGDKRTTS